MKPLVKNIAALIILSSSLMSCVSEEQRRLVEVIDVEIQEADYKFLVFETSEETHIEAHRYYGKKEDKVGPHTPPEVNERSIFYDGIELRFLGTEIQRAEIVKFLKKETAGKSARVIATRFMPRTEIFSIEFEDGSYSEISMNHGAIENRKN